jgi:GTP pyrophosphokinase
VFHKIELREDLYTGIGAGSIVLTDDDLEALRKAPKKQKGDSSKKWTRYIPFYKSKDKNASLSEAVPAGEELVVDRKKPLYLNEENIRRVVMCPHCKPIPGDEVLGYLDEQNRVIVHKRRCDVADRLKNIDGNHIIAVFWDTHKQLIFSATLHMEGIDRVGIIKSLSDVITSQLNVNVHGLSIAANDGLFQGDIELSVHDTEDLNLIIKNLKKIDGIEDVIRVS